MNFLHAVHLLNHVRLKRKKRGTYVSRALNSSKSRLKIHPAINCRLKIKNGMSTCVFIFEEIRGDINGDEQGVDEGYGEERMRGERQSRGL